MLFIVVSLVWGWVIIVVMAIVVAPPLDTLYIIFRGGKYLSVSRSGNQTVGDFKGTSAPRYETEERKRQKFDIQVFLFLICEPNLFKIIHNQNKIVFTRASHICARHTLEIRFFFPWISSAISLVFFFFPDSNLSSLDYVFNGYCCIFCVIVWACVGCKNLCVSDWFFHIPARSDCTLNKRASIYILRLCMHQNPRVEDDCISGFVSRFKEREWKRSG